MDADSFNTNGLAWAVSRWNDEVKHRPLVNVHRRSLDDAWRQVIRYFGGDPDKLLGPSHDTLHMQAQEERAWKPPAPGVQASGEARPVAWLYEATDGRRVLDFQPNPNSAGTWRPLVFAAGVDVACYPTICKDADGTRRVKDE